MISEVDGEAADRRDLNPRSPPQKVDFANNVQLSLTLAALSIGLWWTFDRSRSGFGLGVSIALLATLATQLLVYNGVFQ